MLDVGLQHISLQDQAGELAGSQDGDKPCRFKLFNVMRKSSGAHGLALAHVRAGDSAVSRANLLEYLVAPRIRQRLGDQAYLTF